MEKVKYHRGRRPQNAVKHRQALDLGPLARGAEGEPRHFHHVFLGIPLDVPGTSRCLPVRHLREFLFGHVATIIDSGFEGQQFCFAQRVLVAPSDFANVANIESQGWCHHLVHNVLFSGRGFLRSAAKGLLDNLFNFITFQKI